MKSTNRISKAALSAALLVLCLPAIARGAILVSEIAYDVPGGDSGHEWIEAYNGGSSDVDLAASDFRFFNREGGHKIQSYSGSNTVLGPGAVAIIADNPAIFLADHTGFTGVVLDSSFSLTSSDTIGFRLADGTTFDSVLYDSSLGAAGDGMTLHRRGAGLVAGPATPAVFTESALVSSESNDPPSGASPDTDAATTTPKVSGSMPPPKMEADAGGDRTVEAGAGSFFEGRVYNASGVPLQNCRYLWNFGNGDTAEGQSIFYAYPYPGKYAVVMTVDAGNGYSIQDTITIEAVPAEVAIAAGSDGSVTVTNATHSNVNLDLSLWLIARGGEVFSIPKGTVILPRAGVKFAPSTLGLPESGSVSLLYPSGKEAARGSVSSVNGIEYIPASTEAATRSASPATVNTPALRAEAKAPVSLSSPSKEEQTASVYEAVQDTPYPWWYFALGLFSIIVIGIGGAMYAGAGPSFSLEGLAGSQAKNPYREADEEAAQFTIEPRA